MSTNLSALRQEFLRIGRYCWPALLLIAVLAVLVSRQGIRFKTIGHEQRLDGTYQISLQANTMLDTTHKPDIIVTPQVGVEAVLLGNRITIVSKTPLQPDVDYQITVTNARSRQGQTQSKPWQTSLRTAPAIAYGLRRTGNTDTIQMITLKDGKLQRSDIANNTQITDFAISADYIWYASTATDRSQTLHFVDKRSRQDQMIPLPAAVSVETLSAAKELNQAIVTITSTQPEADGSLAYENNTFIANADTTTLTPLPAPLDTAAVALYAPNGSLYLVQSRDGSVFAQTTPADEPVPLGRTRLAGPFSRSGATVLLRNLAAATILTMADSSQRPLDLLPSTASQVQLDFTGQRAMYSITEFDAASSGRTSLYVLEPGAEQPHLLYQLADNTYSGLISAEASFQAFAVEALPKGGQFDGYLHNAKAQGTQTLIIDGTGKLIEAIDVIDVQWQ